MADAREAAKAEFERFDADGDGLLTAAEIRQVNQALGGQGVTDEEVEAFIAAADSDGDGRIGLEEFVALVGGGRHEKA
ncbi:EF-hand domain-containing protein [Nonomuraea sp. RK-328]|uniref:EF-hand domain-containing protein n=3 Tax=Nonomuraea TaxID=83681 RepID=A0A7Y6M2T7_9ACTN|nr:MULTISPECIES: EF-hand domain-containing protein [Nonomuraea]MBN6052752.1 EF-hand domain-containing protein [Nonomuraea sp. RK-328]MCP2344598.1 Ca2+-binding EF-hand superfamily protein [Nonomuraea roseoviolacea subsp. carminata]NUW31519.1 EF-hand domain-containing protein [Nonomuraea montanisoli]NUW40132.1 EF-hand domain-containing protein [Nonomuraea rhodomycinica]